MFVLAKIRPSAFAFSNASVGAEKLVAHVFVPDIVVVDDDVIADLCIHIYVFLFDVALLGVRVEIRDLLARNKFSTGVCDTAVRSEGVFFEDFRIAKSRAAWRVDTDGNFAN